MSIRIRLESDDDEDENGRSEDENQTLTQWIRNPNDLGGFFIRSTLVFIAFTMLSIIAIVVELLIAADEPFVDQPTLEDPISAWLWLLSQTAAAVSVFGYAAWSFWKQGRLKNQRATADGSSLYNKPIRALQTATADSSDLDEYETQVQKTVFALVLSLIVGYLPVRILLPL